MAPSISSTPGAIQQHRPRQGVQKVVVPAIPLPFIQKRKQQQAARERAKEQATVDAVDVPPASPPPAEAEIIPEVTPEPAIANGSSNTKSSSEAGQISEMPDHEESAAQEVQEVDEMAGPLEDEVHELANGQPEASVHEQLIDEDRQNSASVASATSLPSARPSSASMSTFQMPPAFVPASQSVSTPGSAGIIPPSLYNGQHGMNGMHHGHPSSGSIVFGGYPDSSNSSPAPPTSASTGSDPRYLHQQQQYVNQHSAHHSNGSHTQPLHNGYTAMAPPPGYYPRDNFMNGPPGFDSYAPRQLLPYVHNDGYASSAVPV